VAPLIVVQVNTGEQVVHVCDDSQRARRFGLRASTSRYSACRLEYDAGCDKRPGNESGTRVAFSDPDFPRSSKLGV
jgi:hypothetical protein